MTYNYVSEDFSFSHSYLSCYLFADFSYRMSSISSLRFLSLFFSTGAVQDVSHFVHVAGEHLKCELCELKCAVSITST